MPVNDELGTRMKTFYENVPKTRLVKRTPVAIRIDGKAFHTFTRGFDRPFDRILGDCMVMTMEYLCKNIQGCVFGYCQSDEITLILIDYQKLNSDAWFDYEVQKMCSISASMATMVFNRFFTNAIETEEWTWKSGFTPQSIEIQEHHKKYMETLKKAQERGAMFDARCFNIPKEEVCNLVYWRQLDATRNSIQMVGQANFSHSELHGLSCAKIQDKLIEEKNINWNDFPTRWKRGVACYKIPDEETVVYNVRNGQSITKFNQPGKWVVDFEMPILKGEDRQYVDKHIYVGE